MDWKMPKTMCVFFPDGSFWPWSLRRWTKKNKVPKNEKRFLGTYTKDNLISCFDLCSTIYVACVRVYCCDAVNPKMPETKFTEKRGRKKSDLLFRSKSRTIFFKISDAQPNLPSKASPTWPSPAQPPAAGSLAHPSLRSQACPASPAQPPGELGPPS